MERKIYISAKLLKECIKDRHRLDALAFCVMVKQMFVSSTVKHATIRRLKSVFGIGTDKLRRILRDGKEMNLLSIVDGTLHVASLKGHYGLNHTFAFEHESKRGCDMPRTTMPVLCVVKKLQGLFVRNHIYCQRHNVDATRNCSTANTLKELKRWRKYCKSHDLDDAYETLSNRRLCTLLNRGIRTIRGVVGALVASGEVIRRETMIATHINPNNHNKRIAAYLKDHLGLNGYVLQSYVDGEIYLRLADHFLVSDSVTKLHYVGA